MPGNLKETINRYRLKRFDMPEEVAEFLNCLRDEVPPPVERDVLGVALAIREELWTAPVVTSVVRDAAFPNARITIILKLLASSGGRQIGPQQLDDLFLSRNLPFLDNGILFKVVTRLHRRGTLSAEDVILPKMRWWGSSVVCQEAIPTLRVCAPHRLSDLSVVSVLLVRAGRSRTVLKILMSLSRREGVAGLRRFERSIARLSQQETADHTFSVLILADICSFEGTALARKLLLQMLEVGDHRDIHLLIPFLRPDTDRELLVKVTSSPNRSAANWATLAAAR